MCDIVRKREEEIILEKAMSIRELIDHLSLLYGWKFRELFYHPSGEFKPLMIIRSKTVPVVEMLPGVVRKTLAVGERMLMAEFFLKAGSVVPLHQHPHEQVGYVISGSQRLTIGEKTYLIEAGDAYNIPAGTPHGSEAITDSLAMDAFSPPREDYLPKKANGN